MKRIGFVGLVSLLCVTLTAVGLQAGQQDDKSERDREKAKARDIRNWLPLATGAVWKWRFQSNSRGKKDGTPIEIMWYCMRQVAAHGGKKAWEISASQGKYRYPVWHYWSVEKDGIYRFRNRYLGGRRGVAKNSKPTRLVPGPLLSQKSWEWTEMGSVQTSGDTPVPSADSLRMHFAGQIVALNEKVKVPAGEYRALKIQITMTSKYYGKSEEVLWFVRDVGMVKQVRRNRAQENVWELTGFTAGKRVPPDRDVLIRREIKMHKATMARGKPASIDLVLGLEDYVGSLFYVVSWGRRPLRSYFRHHAGKTTLFQPTLPDAWRELIQSEGIKMSQEDAIGLTKAYGMLVAHSSGEILAAKARGTEIGVQSNEKYDVKAWIRGKNKLGSKARGYSHMWFDKGKLVKMASNLTPKNAAEAGQRRD